MAAEDLQKANSNGKQICANGTWSLSPCPVFLSEEGFILSFGELELSPINTFF